MSIIVKCNGKINPIGENFEQLIFSIFNNEIFNYNSIEIEFYRKNCVGTEKYFKKGKINNNYVCSFNNFESGEKLYYRAKILANENTYYSDFYFVECGLTKDSIMGQWIENINFDLSVSEFKKTFFIDDDIDSARIYIVGLGFYSSTINGKKTDDYFFKPLFTDFDERKGLKNEFYNEENYFNNKKTINYNTFDVKNLLKKGENQLKVLLGTGWYCNTDKDYVDPSYTFGTPKLFFELHITTKKGKIIVKSDESCLVRNLPIRSQMYKGDFIDFSKNKEEYIHAIISKAPTGKLTSSLTENDVILEKLKPIKTTIKNNKIIYDFGKNHTGGLKLKIKGTCKEKFLVKYYEVLLDNGEPNEETCRWTAYLNQEIPVGYIDQQGEYILSGNIDEIEPLFHWNCYRYAVIEKPADCEILAIESLFITTNVEQNSNFCCSLKVLNDLYNAFILTQRDNMHCGVPSDCPHREKLPYTGDGQLVVESAMYSFNLEFFYRKWLNDIINAQGNNGWVPYSAPYVGGGGGYWWSNAITIVPLVLYKFTGDKSIIKDAFEPAIKYIRYCNAMHSGNYILNKCDSNWLLGDWLAPQSILSNIRYINTVAFYSATIQVTEMANILSEKDVVKEMSILSDEIKKAINKEFFDKENLKYGNGQQGENILPLLYDFVVVEYKEALWQKVIDFYKTTKCFDTGIVLTPKLLEALTLKGEYEVVYNIVSQMDYPSFGYMLKCETTLCEHWSKHWPTINSSEKDKELPLTGDVSHCHPMFGSIVAWMYKHIAGLDLSELSNNKVIFAPKFLDFIKSASASKNTANGEVAVSYDYYGAFKMLIKVPNGLIGEVHLPTSILNNYYIVDKLGKVLKSRRRGDYSVVKICSGEWNICNKIM